MTGNNITSKDRIKSVDALRGLAVIFMIAQHLGSWLWNGQVNSFRALLEQYPVMAAIYMLGNIAAPLFITISGFGVTLFYSKVESPDRAIVKRGLFIILLGYLLNIITPHWFSIGSWYILHLIGFLYILSPLLQRTPTVFLIVLFFLLFLLASVLHAELNMPLVLTDDMMNNYSPFPSGLLKIAFLKGHFPVLPWASLFLAGIITCRWHRENSFKKIFCMGLVLLGTGVLLAVFNRVGYAFATWGYLYRAFILLPSFFPPLPPLLLILSSIAIFSLLFILHIKSGGVIDKINPVICLGRTSLSLIIFHIFLFNEISRQLNLYKDFSTFMTCIIILSFILLSAYISTKWQLKEYRYGFEWLTRKIS